MAKLLIPKGVAEIPPLLAHIRLRQVFCEREEVFAFKKLRSLLQNTDSTEPDKGTQLQIFELARSAYDAQIHAEIRHSAVRLWQVGKLLEVQVNGASGPLLTNGLANIFHIGPYTAWLYWYEIPTPQGLKGQWWGAEVEEYNSIFWFRGSRVFIG